ncbi:putative cell cycle sequence binding phosphoprotein (RBP33) [Trypanosoma rangeli]|uniref:Putative cell cycle sequence binding phosphoprotein (RBP33) n=1 Tax=Trypanosoma rangeli TaxID=5698 RepID=A0A422NL84_TRYRA|nr:putative cell cycle sequence binding phosphoprotein (RBP33) [Trypanosoma rangeli]RNF06223.1 putative cell cycle sequence binding phosphoprotein (RBP33) [Trypanosoma rangeli]|eukprot:RNF06223.1 putative cell cycle sequence binding phosphoprotein (RBP33) [Trypanosoma rangeli]
MESGSFQDVTNKAPSKRRAALQTETHKSEGMPVVTCAIIEELSRKVDELSHKFDAIHDLLSALVVQQSQSSFPRHLVESPEALRSALYKEEKKVASAVNVATQQQHTHPPWGDAARDSQLTDTTTSGVPTPEAPREMEAKPYNRKKSPSLALAASGGGHVADQHSWPTYDCFILLVEFKCQRVKRCESNVFIVPGQYAIVQGDRGYDCGVVNQCSEWSAEKGCFVREESLDDTVVNVARMKSDISRVLRVASEEEVERLFGEISRNENLALKTCREIVARLGLEMDVVDCEYQFDQQKISFYYESSRSIDFRHLNSELYRIFGVRIWLQNVNNAVKNVVPAGAMSKDDKAQYRRSGLHPPLR